jgi:hypothetical protein
MISYIDIYMNVQKGNKIMDEDKENLQWLNLISSLRN